MKKAILSLLLCCVLGFMYQPAFSVPAKPGIIEFIQPDGSTLQIYLHGDEIVKWAETLDGYTLMFNSEGYYEYAVRNGIGDMVPSGIVARNIESRNSQAQAMLASTPKGLFYSNEQMSYLSQIRSMYEAEAKSTMAFPTTGNRRLLCILIAYTDKAFTRTQAEFHALFNQVNYTVGGATGSVKDYYLQNSYNQFNLTVDVAGPYTASNTLNYYGANDSYNNDLRPRELVTEAVNLADADTVNFALYDNDSNGSVDGIYVIYAGYGEDSGAPANTIWAHAWAIPTIYKDGKSVSKYSCSAELRGTTGTNITRIGVICHEFGHTLGAPDFYDTNTTTDGQYDGTGDWDMMAGGSWNNGGATPAHHNPYTKIYIYGWASAITLTASQNVAMLNSAQNATSFYRYDTPTTGEYFLLENRQQVGFDAACPGHGMLIYHVDGNYISSHNSANDINATSHQGLFPMAANSSTANGIMTGSGAVSTSGCPWPGTSSKTSFTDATTPNSKSWAAANTAKPISSITENGNIVQFCFISCPAPCTAPTTQASAFSATNIQDNQMQLNWTRGNGTGGVIVLARQGSSVDANPVNGVNYTFNASYGAGMEVGSGNFVVYKGTASNAVVTGLTPGTLYHFAVYEYASTTYCHTLPALIGNATTTGIVPSYCDTLSQFCCTPSLYTVTNSGAYAGYLSGTNSYGFEGFAEYFAEHEPFNQVLGMRVYLGEVTTTTGTANVTFALWDNENGVPTNILASQVVSMANVKTAFDNQGYIDINFASIINAPANGFYLGLLEPGNAAAGDTIAIVTNAEDEGLNSGYTIYGSWSPYLDLFGNSFQHAIYAFTCFDNSLPPVAGFVGSPRRVALGGTVQFTDVSAGTDPTSWAWTFEGGTPATSTEANQVVTYNSLGFFDASLTVSNANGSNSVTRTDYIEVFDPNGTTAFSLDFEACSDFQVDDFDPWTTLDVDASATYGSSGFDFPNESYTGSFIAFNSANTTPAATGWEAHGGNLCGICMAATTPPNNDWLMSTQIELGENSSFSFWAKSITATYGLERFIVYVSTTGNATANFVKISAGTYLEAPTTWTQYTYDLSAYDNMSVYVAIRCVSNDAYAFMLDDIEIYSEYVAPVCDFTADNTTVVEGSTVNFTDLSTQMPTVWQWSFPGGTPSSSTVQNPAIVYSTPGTYNVSLTVTNSAGTDSEVKTGYITVTPTPTVIVLWNFPNTTDNNIADAGITNNLTKTIVPFGGVNDVLYTAAGVSTRSIDGETWDTGNGTKGWSVNFTTLGYGTLKLSFAQMSNHANSPRDFKVQYSLNGTSWTDLGVNITLVEDVWFVRNDIALPAACENKANVYLRWIMTSNTGCGGSTVNSTNTTRRNAMDDIKVTGLPIATPPVADFIASSTQICAGQSVTFSDLSTNTPTSWAWTFAGGSPATSNLQSPTVSYATAGTYQVSLTATNGSGSDNETKVGYITVNANPTVSASNTGPYCVGNTISLNATGSGGTSYSWTGPASFSSTAEDPTRTNALTTHTGNYNVVLTNTVTGCTATASTSVTVNSNPTISASNTGPYCAGQTISLNATGSAGNTFAWSGPNSYSSTTEDPSISNAQSINAGTYTVVYTNTTTNCFASANTIVVVNANPTVSPTNGGPYCAGQTIALTANGSGGTSYAWTGPNSYANATANPSIPNGQAVNAGTYTLVLTNTGTGCTATGTTTVTVNPLPTISASNNGPICAGATLNLFAEGSGGTAYSWTGPVSFSTIIEDPSRTNALTTYSGNYTVVLTNTTTGCTASATTSATVNANPTISASNNGPICAGATLNLFAAGSGGTGYSWTGPASFNTTIEDPSRTNALSTYSGTYTVVLTNSTTGCTASATTNATINDNPTISASNNGPICAGSTLNLFATGSGGTGYSWTGPVSFSTTIEDPSRTNALTTYSGTYTVVLTNTTTGCTASATTSATVNANPTVSASSNSPVCAGNTLQLNATGSGGTSYSWSGPVSFTSTLEDATRTNALTTYSGTYVVSLTNTTTGCTASANTTVTVNANPTIELGSAINSCPGTPVVLDAGAGYSYDWSTGATTQTISVSTSGNYSVTITDGNLCEASDNISVNFYTPASLSMSSTPESGDGANDGTATVTPTGTGPYNYTWSNGQHTASITGLAGGNYSVTVQDGHGCTSSALVNVATSDTPPVANFSASPLAICQGQSVTFTDLSTNGPTSWAWSFTGAVTPTSNLQNPVITYNTPGTYSVTLTVYNSDGNNTLTMTNYITVNANPTLSVSNTGPYCVGNTISLNATGSGGTSYSWTGPAGFNSTSEDATRPNALTTHTGSYSVTLTNTTTTCSTSATTNVTVNANPSVSASNNGPVCAGATLNLNATGSGGTGYSWAGPGGYTSSAEDPIRTNALTSYTGTYTVVLTNTTTGCTATATTSATVNANPTISASNNGPVCAGSTLNLYATGSGGTGYSWTGPASFSTTTEDPSRTNALTTYSGTYTVVLTNTTTGCTASATTSATVNANPTVSASNNGPVCPGENLQLQASGSGGTGFAWTGPAGFTSTDEDPVISNFQAANTGTYTVVYSNSTTGCSASATTSADIFTNPVVNLGDDVISCVNQNVILNAGAGFVSYTWNGTAGGSTLSVSTPGDYTVVVEDANGCTASDVITLSNYPAVTAYVSTTPETGNGMNDGTATVTPTSGTAPFDYVWTSGWTNQTATGLEGGIYCLTVYDANGCWVEACGTVNTNDVPPVAAFSSDITEGCLPVMVNFTDESTNNPLTWLWNFGDGTPESNQQHPTHTFVNAGEFTVTLTVQNLDGSDSYSTTISVYAFPEINLGDDIESCTGNTVVLDAGDNYASYLWTGGIETQSLEVTTDGNYSVQVVDEHGCSGGDAIQVLFNPTPEINLGDDQTLCSNETLVLDAGDNLFSYLWQDGSVDQTYSVTEEGTYAVTITNEYQCTNSDEILITFTQAPDPGLPETDEGCVNEEYTYTLSGAYDYVLWSDESTDNTFAHTWDTPSDYEIWVTVGVGECETTDFMTVIVSVCDGIDNTVTGMQISAYPNPTGKFTTISMTGYNGDVQLVLTDIQGKELWVNNTTAREDFACTIDLSDYVPGMYILQVRTADEVSNLKLIRDK